ncbi:hypothetical protein Pelo_9662 [Pelomyxa schiedti]|nr:hypothetical protein Pelo_9662 [Pelomyxa schiedti]
MACSPTHQQQQPVTPELLSPAPLQEPCDAEGAGAAAGTGTGAEGDATAAAPGGTVLELAPAAGLPGDGAGATGASANHVSRRWHEDEGVDVNTPPREGGSTSTTTTTTTTTTAATTASGAPECSNVEEAESRAGRGRVASGGNDHNHGHMHSHNPLELAAFGGGRGDLEGDYEDDDDDDEDDNDDAEGACGGGRGFPPPSLALPPLMQLAGPHALGIVGGGGGDSEGIPLPGLPFPGALPLKREPQAPSAQASHHHQQQQQQQQQLLPPPPPLPVPLHESLQIQQPDSLQALMLLQLQLLLNPNLPNLQLPLQNQLSLPSLPLSLPLSGLLESQLQTQQTMPTVVSPPPVQLPFTEQATQMPSPTQLYPSNMLSASASSGGSAPLLEISLSTYKIFRHKKFQMMIKIAVPVMEQLLLSSDDVLVAGLNAKCYRENSNEEIESCLHCAPTRKLLTIGASSQSPFQPEKIICNNIPTHVYVFNECKSNCSSSRDHLHTTLTLVVELQPGTSLRTPVFVLQARAVQSATGKRKERQTAQAEKSPAAPAKRKATKSTTTQSTKPTKQPRKSTNQNP